MVLKKTLSSYDNKVIDATTFRSLIGTLQYLTFTRPDISHAINKVCQHFNEPNFIHLKAAKRIWRYLKGTQDFGIQFLSQSPISLYGFCDADWAGYPSTRWSTTGFCIYLGGNCISWCDKKQLMVSCSSSEAEYRSIASTSVELVGKIRVLQRKKAHDYNKNFVALIGI